MERKFRCKKSRRLGQDLSLIAIRDLATKCRLDTKPGMHGGRKGRSTEYGEQLQMKQIMRFTYGVGEKQFVNYYKKASRQHGSTGENLLKILESRLDNVVYRMGFGSTRAESRQLVSHCAILVNGRRLNIPSYLVKPGDVISIREKSKNQLRIKGALSLAQARPAFSWLDININELSGIFKNLPDRSELSPNINEKLVVELYSK